MYYIASVAEKKVIQRTLKDVLFSMRVEDHDFKAWKHAAEIEKISLAAWIRKTCNEHYLVKPEPPWPEGWERDENGMMRPPVAIPLNPRNKKDVETAEAANQIFSVLDKPEHDKTCQCGICDFRRKTLKAK